MIRFVLQSKVCSGVGTPCTTCCRISDRRASKLSRKTARMVSKSSCISSAIRHWFGTNKCHPRSCTDKTLQLSGQSLFVLSEGRETERRPENTRFRIENGTKCQTFLVHLRGKTHSPLLEKDSKAKRQLSLSPPLPSRWYDGFPPCGSPTRLLNAR